MVLLLLNLATHNILTTTIVYQVRCFNRPKPEHVLDWVLDKLHEKYTRITLAWWLHPTARSGVVIDGTWSMTQKFTPVIGPTIVGEDYTDEERLLDYLLATFHPGRDKKSVTQISMFLIFQATCTAELRSLTSLTPVIMMGMENKIILGQKGEDKTKRPRRKLSVRRITLLQHQILTLVLQNLIRYLQSSLNVRAGLFSDKRLSAQSQGTLQWEQDLAEDLQSHYLSVVR
jgi:hypothetical protein